MFSSLPPVWLDDGSRMLLRRGAPVVSSGICKGVSPGGQKH